jgi:4-amino-4-deoxy-L-arabinose transferase-like glycosyltransferase
MSYSNKNIRIGIYHLAVVGVLVLLVGLSLWRVVAIFQQEIIALDSAIFAQMANVVTRSDATLYIDFWDHKPPGIAFFTAPFIVVFGNTTLAIHLAAIALLALFIASIFSCTHALIQNRAASIAAAVLALYYGLLIIYPRILETVLLMTTLATWSFYLAIIARGRPQYLLASGILFGGAVLAKQPIALNLVTLILFAWMFSPKNKGWHSIIFIAIGGAVATGIVLAWSLKSGNFDEMWLYSTVANVRFSLGSEGGWLLGNDGYYLRRHTLPTLLPLIVISLLTSYLLFQHKSWKRLVLLLSWIVPGIMGAILGRGLTLNYFYQLVPPLIILSVAIV